MPRSLSKSQINRLGERLRAATTIEPEDLDLLQQLRGDYFEALTEVQEILSQRLGIQSTSRIKVVPTIVEKLQREQRMLLSRMQDIAGVRIVGDFARRNQDEIAEQIIALFPGARLSDRRARPSHGYRAVHVVVESSGCLVEIQIRTYFQDLWAQVMERLGDIWGRQIRYGKPPNDPDVPLRPGEANSVTRAQALDALIAFADQIAGYEEIVSQVDELESRLGEEAPEDLRATAQTARRTLKQIRDGFLSVFSPLAKDQRHA